MRKPISLKVNDLFTTYRYIVPIYQRNYAWGKKEIEQLLDDIISSNGEYFLGSLIIHKNDDDLYEVIDGQQRLTTLYILLKSLKCSIENYLQFEARKNYESALSKLSNGKESQNDIEVEEIAQGYKIIDEYLQPKKAEVHEKLKEKLENVYLVQIEVPEDIDLNQYFETMNTRGEQLEQHQIVKANLLSCMENEIDRNTASIIWDACANMEHYIQTNFVPKVRNKLFKDEWTNYDTALKWSEICSILNSDKQNNKSQEHIIEKNTLNKDEDLDDYTLVKMLDEQRDNNIKDLKKNISDGNNNENENKVYFESIISFSDFLLHVYAVCFSKDENSSLDDKKLIDTFNSIMNDKENIIKFILKLLELRTLFDTYILKRNKEGKWVINKLKKYTYNNKEQYDYVQVFSSTKEYNRLLYLQAALRITYTSPNSMRWITVLLKELQNNKDYDYIINTLENYCRQEVKNSDYENKSGFDIQRIVFTYLDYLLYCNWDNICKELKIENKFSWDLKFRNSIEHLYPRHSLADNGRVTEKVIENFGNLAVITLHDNIKISNHSPQEKCEFMTTKGYIMQSPKLYIMSKLVEKNKGIWDDEIIEQHKKDMFDILSDDIKKLETGG